MPAAQLHCNCWSRSTFNLPDRIWWSQISIRNAGISQHSVMLAEFNGRNCWNQLVFLTVMMEAEFYGNPWNPFSLFDKIWSQQIPTITAGVSQRSVFLKEFDGSRVPLQCWNQSTLSLPDNLVAAEFHYNYWNQSTLISTGRIWWQQSSTTTAGIN